MTPNQMSVHPLGEPLWSSLTAVKTDDPITPMYSRRSAVCQLGAGLLALSGLAGGTGCGYTVGAPYATDIRTVHVPTFLCSDFRRGYELQLTEAVQKQIQLRTPYRLAKEPGADTRLTGRIVSIDKRVPNQNRLDDPRELELSIGVEVKWEDLRSGRVINQQTVPLAGNAAQLLGNTSFAPEAGQSLATGTQETVSILARQIVELMEVPW